MRDITKLLESIPLDELTGDDSMNKRSEIKVKSKAPAIAVAAACAVVACGGAIAMFAGRDKAPEKDSSTSEPGAVISEAAEAPETTTTTAAPSTPAPVAYTDGSSGRLAELYTAAEQSGDYYEFNKALSEEVNAKYKMPTEGLEDTISFSHEKLGTVEGGSIDLWLSGYSYSYPYLNLMVGAASADGSPLEDKMADEMGFEMISVRFGDRPSAHYSSGNFEKNGSFGLCSVVIMLNDQGEDFVLPDGECDIGFYVSGLVGRNYGEETDRKAAAEMNARFKADLTDRRTVISGLNTAGSWDNKYNDDKHFAMDYTVKELAVSPNGGSVTLSGDINADELQNALFFAENAVAVKTRSLEWLDDNGIRDACDLSGTNAFVCLEMKDGTVRELEYSHYDTEVNSDGTVTVHLDMTTFPVDTDSAAAVLIGSARIELG